MPKAKKYDRCPNKFKFNLPNGYTIDALTLNGASAPTDSTDIVYKGTVTGRYSTNTKQINDVFIKAEAPTSLGEELKQQVKYLEKQLEKCKANEQIISELESKFKHKDIVFHKDLGPCIFRRFQIYGEYHREDVGLFSPDTNVTHGDVLAQLVTADGKYFVPAKEIAPYTESIKLLYETERNKT